MPETLLSIDVNELMPDPTQPRKSFMKEEIERLAASVAARGVLQPLRVLWDADRNAWRIILGESRWRAARLAGLTHVPCLPVDGEVSETDILSDQIIENTVRNSLLPLELARAISKLKALKGCTSQQLSKELGISGASLSKSESLLSLPESIQAMVDDGRVPESAAYEISRLPDEQSQIVLSQSVASKALNRDGVAEAVRNRIGRKSVTPKASRRMSCMLDDGISISICGNENLGWESLLTAIDRLRREAKKLYEGGKDISALAKTLRAS